MGALLLSGPAIVDSIKEGIGNAEEFVESLGCPPGQEQQGLLCYDSCDPGYEGVASVCWSKCGDDFKSNGGVDDGAYCRKYSSSRGVGRPISSCDQQGEYSDELGGLCYKKCPSGFKRVGLSCMEECRDGYTDDGLTCRRNAEIISSNNSGCPWYDMCGLASAKGCSTCPPGYSNDGCTCRRDVDIYGKSISTEAGIPLGCKSFEEYQDGLCYDKCRPGFKGVGPICWQNCPNNTTDIGISCEKKSYLRNAGDVLKPQM